MTTRTKMTGPQLREGMKVALAQDSSYTRTLRRIERDGQVWRLRFEEGAAHRLNNDTETVWVEARKPSRPKPRIFGWCDTPHGARVDVKLYEARTTVDVFWSERFNSYVLAEVRSNNSWLNKPECEDYYFHDQASGRWYSLVSINGAGEVRWSVDKTELARAEDLEEKYPEDIKRWDASEHLAAARHFRLIPAAEENLDAKVAAAERAAGWDPNP